MSLDVAILAQNHVLANVTETANSRTITDSATVADHDIVPHNHVLSKHNVFSDDHTLTQFRLRHIAHFVFTTLKREKFK